jgi:hypothetical protein
MATRIFKLDKNMKATKQGFFSKEKYEKWVIENEGRAALLLQKLRGNYWPDNFDGKSEIHLIKYEKSGDISFMFIYDMNETNKLVRYRIIEDWIVWKEVVQE